MQLSSGTIRTSHETTIQTTDNRTADTMVDNKKVMTKGNVVVNDIKIGDIHYEYEYGMCVKSRVVEVPVRSDDGYWDWKSVHVKEDGTDGEIINYGVNEQYSHYGPNLYNNEAYHGCRML